MPALMQTAVLALLSAGIPMRATATATAIALTHQDGADKIIIDPRPRDVETARSVHVLAFTSKDELLLAESEGDFTVKEWDEVYETAKKICCRPAPDGAAMQLDDESSAVGPDLRQFLRTTMEAKVTADLHWK
jgi:exosome complex component RRP46